MPFHLVFAWMDGRDAIQLSDIQINPSIDASKFTPPDAAGGR
jgi:outer membrane lipoprotein-sorting protein